MEHTKCKATNRSGKPCSAEPWKDGWCRWHHPDLVNERREWYRKGGQSRSNAARAKKALAGDLRDMADVKAKLMAMMTKLEAGEVEPNYATAMATLARAIVVVSGVADFESRLAELQREISELRGA